MSANPDGQKMPRAERHAQVVRMKHAGLTFTEIARALGLAKSTVTSAYYDPTGDADRIRKQKRFGICRDCGKKLFDSGSEVKSERCASCRITFEKSLEYRLAHGHGSERKWSDEAIFEAIRSVARPDGRATAADYDTARGMDPSSMPSLPTIIRRFGKWATAVDAAGCKGRAYSSYTGSLTAEGCMLAVLDCAAEMGRPPTYSEYAQWAKRTDSPCGSTVRNKIGSWMKVTRLVLEQESPYEAVAA